MARYVASGNFYLPLSEIIEADFYGQLTANASLNFQEV